MKIPNEVSIFFSEINPLLKRVEEIAVPSLRKMAEMHKGFFEYRIKSAESFTEKLHKGEIQRPFEQCNDIFAGTIVLPSRETLPQLENEIKEKFQIIDIFRNRIKKPTQFDYDDVHLIISLKPEKFEAAGPIHKLQIELQIKTLLQYAIAKATHDILYKGDKQTSRQIRLAAQLRAILEMAEGLMSKLEVAEQILDFEEDNILESRAKICEFIKENWNEIDVPSDLRRAALTIEKYLELAKISFQDFINLVENNDKFSNILSLRSVEPVTAILAVLIETNGNEMITRARKQGKQVYFLIPSEAEDLLPVLRNIPSELRVDLSCGFLTEET